jgi:hypothetical protein
MTARVSEWHADEELVAVLHSALARDDDEAYLSTLLNLSLAMPDETGDGSWATAPTEVGTVVVAFSSVERMRASPVGDHVPYAVRPVLDLLHEWPNPAWSMLVDGTTDTQVLLEPGAIAQLTEQAARDHPLDAALRSAGGRLRSCLEALLHADVVVPQRGSGSPTRDLFDPGFAWWRTEDPDDEPAVVLFSSPVRLQLGLGDESWLAAPFADVARCLPGGHAALVDPQQHTAARVPAAVVDGLSVALRARTGRPGR